MPLKDQIVTRVYGAKRALRSRKLQRYRDRAAGPGAHRGAPLHETGPPARSTTDA